MSTNAHVLVIARTCHEVNRAYCSSLGDNSQPAWADAPAWQRESAIAGVEAALADATRTPAQSHEGWSAQKVADGWVYGPVKDPAAKTHPCLVPYADLPESQKTKDALFLSVVNALRSFATLAMIADVAEVAVQPMRLAALPDEWREQWQRVADLLAAYRKEG
jgi:hypothetical protein